MHAEMIVFIHTQRQRKIKEMSQRTAEALVLTDNLVLRSKTLKITRKLSKNYVIKSNEGQGMKEKLLHY